MIGGCRAGAGASSHVQHLLAVGAAFFAVVAGGAGALYADEAGVRDWSRAHVGRVSAAAAIGGDIAAVGDDGAGGSGDLVLAAPHSGAVARVSFANAGMKWRETQESLLGAADVTSTVNVVVGPDGVVARSSVDGSLLWSAAPPSGLPAAVAAAPSAVAAARETGVLEANALLGGSDVSIGHGAAVVCGGGSAAAYSLSDGAVIWQLDLEDAAEDDAPLEAALRASQRCVAGVRPSLAAGGAPVGVAAFESASSVVVYSAPLHQGKGEDEDGPELTVVSSDDSLLMKVPLLTGSVTLADVADVVFVASNDGALVSAMSTITGAATTVRLPNDRPIASLIPLAAADSNAAQRRDYRPRVLARTAPDDALRVLDVDPACDSEDGGEDGGAGVRLGAPSAPSLLAPTPEEIDAAARAAAAAKRSKKLDAEGGRAQPVRACAVRVSDNGEIVVRACSIGTPGARDRDTGRFSRDTGTLQAEWFTLPAPSPSSVPPAEPRSLGRAAEVNVAETGAGALDPVSAILLADGARALLRFDSWTLASVSLEGEEAGWRREEALAGVEDVAFVDLPRDGPAATSFAARGNSTDPVAAATAAALQATFGRVLSAVDVAATSEEGESLASSATVVRDRFGLDHVLVAATEAGSVVGVHTGTGQTLWSRHVPGCSPTFGRTARASLSSPVRGSAVSRDSIFVVRAGTASHPEVAVLLRCAPPVAERGMPFSGGVATTRLVAVDPLTGRLLASHVLDIDPTLAQSLPTPGSARPPAHARAVAQAAAAAAGAGDGAQAAADAALRAAAAAAASDATLPILILGRAARTPGQASVFEQSDSVRSGLGAEDVSVSMFVAGLYPRSAAAEVAFDMASPLFVYDTVPAALSTLDGFGSASTGSGDVLTGWFAHALLDPSRSEYEDPLITVGITERWATPLRGRAAALHGNGGPGRRARAAGRTQRGGAVWARYLNSNLLAVASLVPPPSAATTSPSASSSAPGGVADEYAGMARKSGVLEVRLVDAVTGATVHHASHLGAAGPVHLTMGENLVTYSYFSAASGRSELASMEAFEGARLSVQADLEWRRERSKRKAAKLPTHPPLDWHAREHSSFDTDLHAAARVFDHSWVAPFADVRAVELTRTARGIAVPQVLIASASGHVMALDRTLVDPRRPAPELFTPEHRAEENLIPDAPTIFPDPRNMVNYNRVVSRLQLLRTQPTEMESTSLVVAAGLDLFVTRVNPSGGFDFLDPSFSHNLLILVVGTLAVGTVVAQHLSRRRSVRQSWR